MTAAIRTAPAPGFNLSAFVRRYPFAFALVISVVLLALNIIVQPNFGPVQQLASYAPIAFAAIGFCPIALDLGLQCLVLVDQGQLQIRDRALSGQ